VTRSHRSARRLAGGLAAAALVMSAATGLGAGTAEAVTQVSTGGMVSDVNQARQARGVPSLDTDGSLASVALAQARRMASRDTLYHNPNLQSDVTNYRWVGENVGYGPSLDVIQDAFMKSPSHKANILDRDFTEIGIAAVKDGDGRTWVAQVFRRPSSDAGSSTRSTGSGTATKPEKKAKTADRPRKRTTRSTTSAKSATVEDRTPATRRPSRETPDRAAASTPRPTPSARPTERATASPSASPTLDERVLSASRTAPAAGDPVADALAFADAMQTVGG
jgi:hypothetical protein